jgi:uncharacterized membrane protein
MNIFSILHGIIVCVLGSKEGPPIIPLHIGIVTLAFVPFAVVEVHLRNHRYLFDFVIVASKRFRVMLVVLSCLYPIHILKVRFAKGEISKKEYEEMRKMLESK